AKRVDLRGGIARRGCAVLRHEPVAVAREALECAAEHLRHAAIALSRLEEANAAIVSVPDQPGELRLSQFPLYAAAESAGSEGEPRDLHVGFAECHPVGSRAFGSGRNIAAGA